MDGVNGSDKPMVAQDAPDALVTTTTVSDGTEGAPALTYDQQVVTRALARYEYELGMDSENRDNHVRDLKFAWVRGEQWNQEIRKQRETANPPRPWLEFNQTGQFIKQIVNDQRQNQPAIKVRPKSSGASQKVADIFSGIVRDIEYASKAPAIYDSDLEQAVTGGRGYHRIVTEWEKEDSYNQVARIRPIPDAMTVVVDSSTIEPDKCDMKYGFVMEWLDREVFEKEWPERAGAISWDIEVGSEYACWFVNNKICVADYYEVVEDSVALLALSDGTTMWRDDFERKLAAHNALNAPQIGMATPEPPVMILREEMRKRSRVDWYKLTADDTPLARYDWAGKYVPIVMCPGDEITITGQKIYQGIIRRLRDAQMMYNYWFTLATERIALAPKAPYVALDGQIENHPEWKTLNVDNHGVLEYTPIRLSDGSYFVTPPARTESIPVDAGLVTMLQLCAQNLREITGMKDAALGQSSPDQPWRAILAQQRKGDTATFHYGDNLARAVALTGRILVDLITNVYDVERIVNTIAEDGSQKQVAVNQRMPGEQPGMPDQIINNLRAGEYDVVVDVGPSFATRRIEAASEMKEFMQALGPEQASIMGAVFAKSVDWPGDTGEKISALLTATLPQPLQDIVNGDDSTDPQVAALKAALQAQQQQFKQAMMQVNTHIADLTQKNAELTLKNANNAMDFAAKMVETATKRDDMSQARAMESENNAQQEFTAKLASTNKFMESFIKVMQMGGDPVAIARLATQVTEGASGALRSGPDFSESMNLLMKTAQDGNQNINNIVGSILPSGVPDPMAPMGPQGNAPGPQAPFPQGMPPNGAGGPTMPPNGPPPGPPVPPGMPPNGAQQ